MSEKQGFFTLLNGKVKMAHGFYNPTSDAVWLAAFAPKGIQTVLDVGIGTGGVSLCLLSHFPNLEITGLDISQEMLDECEKNTALNNQTIKLLNVDISKWSTTDRFDLVITNPPYFNGTPAKHNAHHNADIKNWTMKSCARVKPNGYICIIIDALCVAKIISVLDKKHFGNIEIFPLFGAKNSAERVLIRAKQGVRTGTTIFQGTSMNNNSILRDGLTIDSLLSTLGTL
ncbi:MAG: methyltransferase [Alphaproteobacteria bacterium]|nr:methyltransferase [Alphaproteobacteria bacterium]